MARPTSLFSWEHDPTIERVRSASGGRPAGNGLPDGAKTVWALKRDPPRPHDTKLSPLAARWLDELPDGLRPALLADRYPRLANRLALSWSDAVLAELLLTDLLQDRRGGRKGFAPEIRDELKRLAADVRTRKPIGF